MLVRLALSLLTLGVVIAYPWHTATLCLQASETDPLLDTDGDFLPDCVEWAVLTSASSGDTDGDLTPDFVEVVQRGTPRQPGEPLPLDQEMRIVITGPQPGTTTGITWMHLFLRLAEPSTPLQTFAAWLEVPFLPGVRLSFDMFALGPAVYRERNAGTEGVWIQLSVPLVSTQLLHQLLPCSIQAESTLGGRYVRSGVKLFDVQGTISTLAPFDHDHYAVQSIAPVVGGGGLSNRVCLLELVNSGSSPGGTLYTVHNASCEDANELECVLPTCTQSIGWVLTIPGGLGVMGGSN